MPDRTITHLSFAAGILFAAYIALVGVTVYFATVETKFSAQVQDLESKVSALETEYYSTLSRVSDTDASHFGFVTPTEVLYVAKNGEPSLTRAER